MSAVDLPLTKLRRRVDARAIRKDVLPGIADSIREVGIISPLRVRPIAIFEGGAETEGWEITAGNHRFEAAKLAGLSVAPCIVVAENDLLAELAMIDENLCRAELSPADRASNSARRKEVYLILHPETAQHVAGGRAKHGSATDNLSFAHATSAVTGRDARTVRRDVERGEKISDRALSLVAGTHLDSGAYLDKLKKLGPNEQEARVQRELTAPRKPVSPAPEPRNEFESEQLWLAKGVKWLESGSAEWRERARDHLFPDSAPIMDRRHG